MNSSTHSTSVSRLTQEEHPGQANSGRFDKLIYGYLSIRVAFLGEPVSDLAVWFWNDEAAPIPPRKPPKPLAGRHEYELRDDPDDNLAGWTNSQGEFHFTFRVPVGTYSCKIQGQPPTDITTVEHVHDPFVLVLPIGRSYFDVYALKLLEKQLPR